MSVYSYVELKVHTNVQKVGTHLNVWYIERMFAESTPLCFLIITSVLYIYNEHTFSRPFSTFLFFSLLYYIYIRETLFPALILSRTFLTLSLFTLLLYTLYIEEYTFPQLFTLCPPFFYPFIKWTPLHRHFPYFFIVWEKFAGKSF